MPLALSSPPPLHLLHSSTLHHHLSNCHSIHQLKQIHANAIRTFADSSIYTGLLRYFAAVDPDYAYNLLYNSSAFSITAPSPSSFNTLLRSFAFSDGDRKHCAIQLFSQMLDTNSFDHKSFPLYLKACAYLFALSEGLQAHQLVIKLGLSQDVYIANSLIHFYSSCGCLHHCINLFDRLQDKSQVSWNVTIDAYATNADYANAVTLFASMQRSLGPTSPDIYALQSLARACAGLGSLSLGLWIHAYAMRNSLMGDVLMINSLIDVYAKCGAVDLARQLFDEMGKRDITSWNAIILGLSMHGRVHEALKMFDDVMNAGGIRPNSITFVGVLSACNHGGLIAEGRRCFSEMINSFGIKPQLEHYGCMIDLLARAGLIDEALDLVSSMPCKPDAVIWRSLLGACCKLNVNIEFSETVAKRVIESEQNATSGVFVLMSRVYASANRWNDVGLVRKLMNEEGIQKEPGCSSVEIDGAVHEFIAGDTTHPQSEKIYKKLEEIQDRLASVGYTPDSSQAPLVSEAHGEKEDCLRLHSERLAIAFGLINTVPGAPIRVLKNLRICKDCHTITKLISRLYGIEIIVRDRLRFHHFRDGSCSCMDYW